MYAEHPDVVPVGNTGLRVLAILLLLSGCEEMLVPSSRPVRPSATPIAAPTTPPTTIEPPTLLADCLPAPDNALRFECWVEILPFGPVEITFQPTDGSRESITHASAETLGFHEIGLYFMTPSTDYTWTASPTDFPAVSVSGQVTTGVPPVEADVFGMASGVSTADAFLMTSPCGASMPIVVSSDGVLLWYEQQLDDISFTDGLIHTVDDTVMFMKGGFIENLTWMGEEVFRLDPVAERLHHDMFRRGGLNYVLFQEPLQLWDRVYQMDGFIIFDDTGYVVADWHLIDHFMPPDPGTPGGPIMVDYSHANSIFVQDDGDILLSLRHLSAVLKVNGDVADPDFGEIVWRLSGDPANAEFGTDFTLTSSSGMSADFGRQHNFHQLPDGRFAMFDNRLADTSRVSILAIDEVAGTADIEQSWDTGQTCIFQGSAWFTAVGNPVGVCAPNRTGMEFDIGGYPWSLYSLTVGCSTGMSVYVARYVPLEL